MSPAIRLYAARLDAAQPAGSGLLDAEESARAARLVFERDRRRFLAAHGFLRSVLGRELCREPSQLAFVQGPHGKPRVVGARLHFSLTHTAEHALLAVAETELGLDAEELRPERVDAALAERVMHAEEFATWSRAAREPQVGAFFRLWSAKESLMKATGLGLALGPRGFAVFAPGRLELLPQVDAAGRAWTLRELAGPAGLALALASTDTAAVQRIDWR